MNLKRVGLLGWPVEHSISPAIQNAAFQALALSDWQYELFPTPPDQLAQRIARFPDNAVVGANVTIPHKQSVIDYLDRVAIAARGMNAVNTIVVEDGQLVGHNTDSAGFILDLESHGIQVYGQHALLLGAGGAAHAAALGLANRGTDVTVIARREQAAWDLRNHVRRRVSRTLNINAANLTELARLAPTANLIVNCTPVGMWPRVEASIWPEEVEFPPDGVVYDMVYRPRQTALMKAAQASGLTVIGGLGMLVQQGALAFELWTGQIAPLDIMREAAQAAISSSENYA